MVGRLAFVLLAAFVAIAPCVGNAQSRPLSAARLHVSVEIDSQNMFVYRYIVENGAGSTAGISRMTIDISSRAGAAVPVTFSAPQGWRTTAGTDATARWVATNDRSLIVAKQRLAGFSLSSNSPPSLRRFTLAPYIDPDRAPVTEPGDDPGEQDRYQQELDQYVESQSAMGMTLAPAASGAAAPDVLLANLANQVGQARTLRWITSDAIARNVADKLQAARAAILRRQSDMAGNILRALRTDIAAQSGKTLRSEAVALVDVNLQYTLRLLAKPQPSALSPKPSALFRPAQRPSSASSTP